MRRLFCLIEVVEMDRGNGDEDHFNSSLTVVWNGSYVPV
jgi:hypothetical protein